MPWFCVDDGLSDHPKADDAGNSALGLWVRLGSYCAKHLTDGRFSAEVARRYGTDAELKRLIKAGMVRKVKGGYVLHDYLKWNLSRATVEANREAAKKRMQALRSRRGVTANVRANERPNQRGTFGVGSPAPSVLSEQGRGGAGRAAPPPFDPSAACPHGAMPGSPCIECRGLRVVNE